MKIMKSLKKLNVHIVYIASLVKKTITFEKPIKKVNVHVVYIASLVKKKTKHFLKTI